MRATLGFGTESRWDSEEMQKKSTGELIRTPNLLGNESGKAPEK